MANMYQNEIGDFRKRLLEEIEESKKHGNYGQCAKISQTYCGASYPPPPVPPQTCVSYQEPTRRLTDEEIYYRSVGEQNQRLLKEKEQLMKVILSLQNEVRRLKEENTTFVAKEEKGKVFKDKIVTIKGFFENLYNKTIEWFNT